MEEETADELWGLEAQGLVAGFVAWAAVVLPLKGDVVLVEVDEARVGDGDAVGVAGEVVQDLSGSSPRGSGIEVPLLLTKWGDEVSEGAGMVKVLEMAEEV